VGTILIFLVYPGVSATLFKMLLPPKNISGTLYVDSDLSLLAHTPEYDTFVALSWVGIVVYSIPGIPMYLFLVLRYFRAKIYSSFDPASDLKIYEAFIGTAEGGLQRVCRGCLPTRFDMAIVHVEGSPPLEADRFYTVVEVSEDECMFTLDSETQLFNDTSCEDANLAKMSVGWLCQNYECEFFYWECIEFWRKLLLSSAVIFFRPGSTIQVLLGCIICVLFLFLVSSYKPYRDLEDDHTNSLSFLCLTFTLMLGMALRLHEYEASADIASATEAAAFAWILFLVNIALVVYSVYSMATGCAEEYESRKRDAKVAAALVLQPTKDIESHEL